MQELKMSTFKGVVEGTHPITSYAHGLKYLQSSLKSEVRLRCAVKTTTLTCCKLTIFETSMKGATRLHAFSVMYTATISKVWSLIVRAFCITPFLLYRKLQVSRFN